MKPIRGVILDVDGTLVDSNDAHARSWVEALAENNIDVDYEKVRRLIGMGGDKLLPEAAGLEEDSSVGKKISESRSRVFKTKYLPQLKPFPRVKELLARMKDEGLRLVVASSAKEDELKELLKIAEATEFIEEKTSSSDADNSKPDPDIVQAALDELGLPRDEVLMIGDTPYDVEAAARAGIKALAFRSGGWDDEGLRGAAAVYDSAADLLAKYDSSPFSYKE